MHFFREISVRCGLWVELGQQELAEASPTNIDSPVEHDIFQRGHGLSSVALPDSSTHGSQPLALRNQALNMPPAVSVHVCCR